MTTQDTQTEINKPFGIEMNLAEYVRTHAQTIFGREAKAAEVEEIVYEHLFEHGGLDEITYEAALEFAMKHGLNQLDS